jgi:hypothetical protein
MGSPFGEAACKLKLFAWRRRFWRGTAGFALGIGLHCYSVASNDNTHIFPATQLASSFSILAVRTFMMLWLSAAPPHFNATALSITMLTFLFDLFFTTAWNASASTFLMHTLIVPLTFGTTFVALASEFVMHTLCFGCWTRYAGPFSGQYHVLSTVGTQQIAFSTMKRTF